MDPRETIAGSVGAFCCISAGLPFDTVKTRMQQGGGSFAQVSPLECAIRTVKSEGPSALFKGFTPALASATIENVVVWTVNSFLRNKLEEHHDIEPEEIRNQDQAMLGALTGACSAICICPAEVIKVRLQTRTVRTSPLTVLGQVLKESGPKGLFLGLTPLLMRDVPFYFLFFGALETYFDKVADGNKTLFHSAVGGGVAGSIAWSVIFPLDVLKTKMQVSGNTTIGTLKMILRTGGVNGLFRGWLPAVLRGFPANGALVFGVDLSRSAMDYYFDDGSQHLKE